MKSFYAKIFLPLSESRLEEKLIKLTSTDPENAYNEVKAFCAGYHAAFGICFSVLYITPYLKWELPKRLSKYNGEEEEYTSINDLPYFVNL